MPEERVANEFVKACRDGASAVWTDSLPLAAASVSKREKQVNATVRGKISIKSDQEEQRLFPGIVFCTIPSIFQLAASLGWALSWRILGSQIPFNSSLRC